MLEVAYEPIGKVRLVLYPCSHKIVHSFASGNAHAMNNLLD